MLGWSNGISCTVAPACKVSVLSKEMWPYKRADLTSGLYPTIADFYWDPPKIDLTSVDLTSRPQCSSISVKDTFSTVSISHHEWLHVFLPFQTLEVLRLQTELEEYEYEDANEWRRWDGIDFAIGILDFHWVHLCYSDTIEGIWKSVSVSNTVYKIHLVWYIRDSF